MIVSDVRRYVFIELPRTGCTAIARELRANYDGRPFMRKHSTYYDFLSVATSEQKKYFVFSGVRNPLDDAVSGYFKYVTDHKGHHTGRSRRPRKQTRVAKFVDHLLWRLASSSEQDFPTFFRRVYVLPYDNWSSQAHHRFGYVIRFERLQEDFAAALRAMGIEPIRPVPVWNPTRGRERGFATYYTPDIIPRAKRVFGPFMRRWGYEFPHGWESYGEHRLADLEYRALRPFRHFYWRHIRPRVQGGPSTWRGTRSRDEKATKESLPPPGS